MANFNTMGKLESIRLHPKIYTLLLVVLTLVAGALRLYKLGAWSFWIDEIFSLQAVQSLTESFSVTTPVTVWLIAFVRVFLPESEWSARLAPALIGTLTVPVVYFVVRKLFNPAVGLLAAFILVISPWHLYWSQNARFYIAQMLFYFLAQFAFFFWLEKERRLYLLATLLFLGLAILERMTALFFLPVVLSYGLMFFSRKFGRPAGLHWKNLAWFVVPVMVFGLVRIGAKVDSFRGEILANSSDPLRVFLSIVYELGVPLVMLAILGGVLLVGKSSRGGLFLFLGACVPVILLVVLAPFSLAASRYVFITLPNWAILGAVAVEETWSQSARLGKLLAVFLLLILAAEALSRDYLYFGYQNGNRPDWKGAFTFVEKRLSPGDQVVTTRTELGKYYLDTKIISSQTFDPAQFDEKQQRAWFVLDNQTGNISMGLIDWVWKECRLVSLRDTYLPGKNLEMRVFLCGGT